MRASATSWLVERRALSRPTADCPPPTPLMAFGDKPSGRTRASGIAALPRGPSTPSQPLSRPCRTNHREPFATPGRSPTMNSSRRRNHPDLISVTDGGAPEARVQRESAQPLGEHVGPGEIGVSRAPLTITRHIRTTVTVNFENITAPLERIHGRTCLESVKRFTRINHQHPSPKGTQCSLTN